MGHATKTIGSRDFLQNNFSGKGPAGNDFMVASVYIFKKFQTWYIF
jgi:hypothetical protein